MRVGGEPKAPARESGGPCGSAGLFEPVAISFSRNSPIAGTFVPEQLIGVGFSLTLFYGMNCLWYVQIPLSRPSIREIASYPSLYTLASMVCRCAYVCFGMYVYMYILYGHFISLVRVVASDSLRSTSRSTRGVVASKAQRRVLYHGQDTHICLCLAVLVLSRPLGCCR